MPPGHVPHPTLPSASLPNAVQVLRKKGRLEKQALTPTGRLTLMPSMRNSRRWSSGRVAASLAARALSESCSVGPTSANVALLSRVWSRSSTRHSLPRLPTTETEKGDTSGAAGYDGDGWYGVHAVVVPSVATFGVPIDLMASLPCSLDDVFEKKTWHSSCVLGAGLTQTAATQPLRPEAQCRTISRRPPSQPPWNSLCSLSRATSLFRV